MKRLIYIIILFVNASLCYAQQWNSESDINSYYDNKLIACVKKFKKQKIIRTTHMDCLKKNKTDGPIKGVWIYCLVLQ